LSFLLKFWLAFFLKSINCTKIEHKAILWPPQAVKLEGLVLLLQISKRQLEPQNAFHSRHYNLW
jgi:hypothetical protein